MSGHTVIDMWLSKIEAAEAEPAADPLGVIWGALQSGRAAIQCLVLAEAEGAENKRRLGAFDEMLAALRWLTNALSGVGKAGGPPESGELTAAMDAARDAIAKAER